MKTVTTIMGKWSLLSPVDAFPPNTAAPKPQGMWWWKRWKTVQVRRSEKFL